MSQNKIKLKKLPPLFVIKVTGFFRELLMSVGRRMFPPEYVMMEYASAFWIAKAIGVACDLNLADILGDRTLHISKIAEQTGTHEQSLYRLMRLLAANGIFRNTGGQNYRNNKYSKALLDEAGSMKYFIKHHIGSNNWKFVGELEDCIRTGENAITMQTGLEPFDFLENTPDKGKVFNKAMTNASEMSAPLFLSAYRFGKFKKIVDIGGGHGFLIAAIASKYPLTECIVYDLPHVAPDAARNFEKFNVTDRCRFVSGSFFDEIPPEGDLYILKNIIHDWDDEKSIVILSKIADAMNENGHLLVIDAVMDDKPRSTFGKMLDIQMLVGTSGGRERSFDEFSRIFLKSGFKLTRVIGTASPFSIIEGRKNHDSKG